MTALAADKSIERRDGVAVGLPVEEATKIYGGALCCVNAAGYVVPGADTAGLIFAGVSEEQKDNTLGADGDLTVELRRRGLFKVALGHTITQANVGDNVFLVDDQTVDLAANTTNDIYCGVIAEFISGSYAWIDIEPAIKQADVATHIADTSGAHAASAISFADSGSKTAATEVDAALDEIYVDLTSAAHVIPIDLNSVRKEDGTALTALAADAVPGFTQLSNKELVLAWAADATPLAAAVTVPLVDPAINDAADIVVHYLARMGGATDTPVLAMEAYIGAGDTDCMGADDEIDGGTDLTEYSATIAAADVPAAPTSLTLILTPTAGQMGTDALYVYAIWLEVTRKLRTA